MRSSERRVVSRYSCEARPPPAWSCAEKNPFSKNGTDRGWTHGFVRSHMATPAVTVSPEREVPNRRPPALFEDHQQVARIHRVAQRDQHVGDGAVQRARHGRLHLHGFQREQVLSRTD